MERNQDRSGGEATIFALSTAQGRSGVAIIRVSGPGAKMALEALTAGAKAIPRFAKRVRFHDPETLTPIDDGLALWFPAPASFTGEDVVELHVHGGRAVVSAMLAVLGAMPGLKLAEPGEFSRRAFENGKLDLTQTEGLADLIDAETEGQRQLAYRQMEGALREKAESWRETLIGIQGLTEAAIDFSDEADVAADAISEARRRARTLETELERCLQDRNRGEILRDGFRVAVMGPPNAGKSSLINRLAGRNAVIVSAEAGTTRDVVELHLNLGGLRVIVADTAGVRETEGEIEREGIRRGLAWAREANLVLWLTDACAQGDEKPLVQQRTELRGNVIVVRTKMDLKPDEENAAMSVGDDPGVGDLGTVGISSRTGDGIDRLVDAIARAARDSVAGEGELPLIAQARHRKAIEAARDGLRLFDDVDENHIELAAEHVRAASFAIGRLTGRVDVEEILGEIFSRFCIGK